MGIFNFLETFFIISLAIMFILVGLLMYHNRGRLNVIEERTDSLFEIVTNLTNEITAQKVYLETIKYTSNPPPHIISYQPGFVTGGNNDITDLEVINEDNEDAVDDADIDEYIDAKDDDSNINKIVVSDDGDSYMDDMDDMDDMDEVDINTNTDIMATASQNEIHVIKLEPSAMETLDLAQQITILRESNEDKDDCVEVSINDTYTEEPEQDNSAAADNEVEEIMAEHEILDEQYYHKMNVTNLRKIATERGFDGEYDISKMKKAEIIALLL